MILIRYRYGIDAKDVVIPGDCFDVHGEFIHVGCNGELVAMVRTDDISGIFITDKKE